MHATRLTSIVLILAGGIGFRFATAADAVTAQASHEGQVDGAKSRVLTILAVADDGYRKRFPEWRARIEGIVSVASARYETDFSIRLHLSDCHEWPFRASLAETDKLNQQLFKISPNDADVVVAFVENVPTGLMHLLPHGKHTEGYSFCYGRYVVVGDIHDKTTEAEMILMHELAHVFGAFHVGDRESIMQTNLQKVPTRFEFDEATKKVIQLSRNVDLRVGVGSLDADQVKKLRALFRAHGRPQGHVDEEDPIILALLTQAHRERLAGNTARAKEFVLRAQRFSPESARAQIVLAEIAIAQGDNEEAVRRLEAAVTLNPENVYALVKLAELRLELGQARSALQEQLTDDNNWPKYDSELDGFYELHVVNPHDFPVVVGLRCDGEGRDFAVAPNRTRTVNVHAGKIDVFFRHRDYPGGAFQGDSFTYRPGGGWRTTRTLRIPKPGSTKE